MVEPVILLILKETQTGNISSKTSLVPKLWNFYFNFMKVLFRKIGANFVLTFVRNRKKSIAIVFFSEKNLKITSKSKSIFALTKHLLSELFCWIFLLKWLYRTLLEKFQDISWAGDVVVIATAQFHSIKPEPRFYADSNPFHGV